MSLFSVKAESCGEKTVVSDIRFTAPIKAAKPFYKENFTEVMVMIASAGMLDGDRYDIRAEVEAGASLKITGQSYSKIFRAETKGTEQSVNLIVHGGGALYYSPPPVIPFGGSVFKSAVEVRLEENARFACSEIICCGRSGMGEMFRFDSFISRTAVYSENRLCLLDNTRLIPTEAELSGIGFFENKKHIGMLYCYNFEPPGTNAEDFAVSRAAEGFIVRAIANSAEEIESEFNRMTSGFFGRISDENNNLIRGNISE